MPALVHIRPDLDVIVKIMEEAPPGRAWNSLFQYITNLDPYLLEGIILQRVPVPDNVSAREIIENLVTFFEIRKSDAADLLGISPSRISRNDQVDPRILDRVYAIAHTFVHAAAVLGPEDAVRWFKTANPALDNEAPLALLGTSYGEKLVDNLITGLLHGAIV